MWGWIITIVVILGLTLICYISSLKGSVSSLESSLSKEREENKRITAEVLSLRENAESVQKLISDATKEKEFYESRTALLNKCVEEKAAAFPHIAAIKADLLILNHTNMDLHGIKYYHWKNPNNRQISEKIRQLEQAQSITEYKINYIYAVFPGIKYFVENNLRYDATSFNVPAPFCEEIALILSKKWNLEDVYNSIYKGRLENAFNSKILIDDLNITAQINSNGNVYSNVTLDHCECMDFQINKKPCKHMLYLAYALGALQINGFYLNKLSDFSMDRIRHLTSEKIKLEKKIQEEKAEKAKIEKAIENECEEKRAALDASIQLLDKELKSLAKNFDELMSLIPKKAEAYPIVAAMIADYLTIHYKQSADILENKPSPALKEAKRIRELQQETKQIIADKKILEYKLAYIEKLFPNINDIFDDGFTNVNEFELETESNTDRTRCFMSHDEYINLSVTERNQLALDRYLEREKSKWQIGRDYEMYIGQEIELRGYTVTYTGILKNLEDMGRDLIAENGITTYIIQCKNWAQEKTIHEKHIFQLYGTVVLSRLKKPQFDVQGVFVTSTVLSSTAKAVAEELGITVLEKIALKEFPRIKCNINRATGEKIYHLPFDQQYDTTVIDRAEGEMYAKTVADAEAHGFRRAFRHISKKL